MKQYQSSNVFALTLICASGCFFSASVSAATTSTTDVASNIATVKATNPSNFARSQEPLYFSFYDLGLAADDSKAKFLVAQQDGNILPSQLIDTNNDSKPDTLLVAPDFAPAQSQTVIFRLAV